MADQRPLYDSLLPLDKSEALGIIAAGDPAAIGTALLRLALHEADWRFVQDLCITLSDNPDVWVRRNCATALGHLARIHRRLDVDKVPVLAKLERAPP